MGIMDTRKPGLSNPIAKQEGYPTSGEMSANAGQLPAQRQQGPYDQTRAQTNMPQPTAQPPKAAPGGSGTLNGGAFQGAQYKLNAQPMSSGVASFVSIPQGTGGGVGFNAPKPAVPGSTPIAQNMQQQPQFFAGPQGQQQQQQQQQNVQTAPTVENPPTPTVQGPPTTTVANQGQQQQSTMPMPGETQYDYDKRLAAMGSYYDMGGAYDRQQQAIMAEQQRQQNLAGWAQNQLAGRGGNIAQVAQNYANTMAALQSDAERAKQAQGAHQAEFANRMAYNDALNKVKMDAIRIGTELGFNISEQDYNQAAAELIGIYGQNVTPGMIVDRITKGATNSKAQQQREQQISNWINDGSSDNWRSIYNTFAEMSDEELKNYGPEAFQKAASFIYNQSPTKGQYLINRAAKLGLIIPNLTLS